MNSELQVYGFSDSIVLALPPEHGNQLTAVNPQRVYYWITDSLTTTGRVGNAPAQSVQSMVSISLLIDTLVAKPSVYGRGPELVFQEEGVYHLMVGSRLDSEMGSIDLVQAVQYCPPVPTPPDDSSSRELTFSDFLIEGVPAFAKPWSEVRASQFREVFGDPDSTTQYRASSHWHYRDMTAEFFNERSDGGNVELLYAYVLHGPRYATHRGVRVNDESQRVERLYGRPDATSETEWVFEVPYEFHGISFLLRDGRVRSIRIGGVQPSREPTDP